MHQIGTGVLGPVFRTYDPESDRLVAVKAFSLDFTPEQAEIYVEALKRIVEAGFSHPAIVAPLDAGLEDGIPFLATEYVTAESLDVAVHHVAPAPADKMVMFVGSLAAAVDAAHARGVMHGGLHARDVFLAPDITRVNGFGVASALEHVGLKVPVRRPYTAPEIISGRSWGPEADRFSVATIAYELLTGKRLVGTGDEVLARLVTIESVNAADPSGLQQAFRNALADDPAIRPASAAGFVMALGDAVGLSSDEIALAMSGVGQETLSDLSQVDPADSEDGSAKQRDARLVVETVHQEEPAADGNLHTEFIDSLDETFELTGSDEETDSLGQEVSNSSPSFLTIENIETISDARVVDLDEVGLTGTDDNKEIGVDEESETQVVEQATENDAMLPLELEAEVEAGNLEKESPDPTDREAFSDALVEHVPYASLDLTDLSSEKRESESNYAPVPIDDEALGSKSEDISEGGDYLDGMDEEDQVENVVVSTSASATSSSGSRPSVATDEFDKSASSSVESFWSISSFPSLARIASTLFAMVVGIALAYLASVGLGTTRDDELAVPAAETSEAGLLPPGDAESLSETRTDDAIPLGSQSGNNSENIAPVSGETISDPEPEVSPIARSPELTSSSVGVSEPSPISQSTLSPEPLAQESTPSLGWLLVRTEPPGANVSIDGEDRGLTPLSLSEVPSGVYRLEISVPGYRPEQRTLEISSDKTVAAISIVLEPFGLGDAGNISAQSSAAGVTVSGSMLVDSRPIGASVFLDGESVGVTPLIVQDVIVGSHEVRILGDGYRSWVSTVQVEDGQRSRVAASLEPTGRR